MDRTGHYPVLDHLGERSSAGQSIPSPAVFMRRLVESQLLAPPDLESFLKDRPGLRESSTLLLADALVAGKLVTPYQLKCILSGNTFGLVLGNYRIVDRIGSGGMGVVYKAEHVHMKRPVAIKVLYLEDDANSVFLQRFKSEMQALAALRHPNIVLAFDAGAVHSPADDGSVLRYLVMEYVPGKNLEQFVTDNGRLAIPLACDFIRQTANGLRHAHEHGLVHRDIKPSNLLVTDLDIKTDGRPGSQIKILDFGLTRLASNRHTEAHCTLGTVDYMAPEQARDARSVDIRADIYGLGGTLYWLLTGKKPFPGDRPPLEELLARQHETPVPPRQIRPDIPLELETIICQMMARDPSDRYPTPLALISALNNFLEPTSSHTGNGPNSTLRPGSRGLIDIAETQCNVGTTPDAPAWLRSRRLLLVSNNLGWREKIRTYLGKHGMVCGEADHEGMIRPAMEKQPADLLVVDQPTARAGLDLCRRVRAEASIAHLKIILVTGEVELAEQEAFDREPACDDILPAAVTGNMLIHRMRAALRLKEVEERSDRLAGHLLATNGQLEQAMQQRDDTSLQMQEVLIFAMAKMAQLRGQETGGHLIRMQKYVRVLADQAKELPALAPMLDDAYIRMLERCVLLHDIGKVAIPDHILLKPGKLDPEERSIVESHTFLGANILEAVARQHGANLAFLQMASDIVRYHHERYDGSGYPDGRAGEDIPLAARITAIADVYDAMRSKLVYKPGLSHAAVSRLLQNPGTGQFDPALLVAFRQCENNFKQIFEQNPDHAE